MKKDNKIYIAGHSGLVGSAVLKKLNKNEYNNLIYKRSSELDLRIQKDVDEFFEVEKPDHVFLLAAKVGGINANQKYPAEFIYDNLMIQNNVINAAYKYNVEKLLFLGSSCIYPRNCKQPMKEEYLLTGKLEKTNEAYSIAKIAGLKMCGFYNKQYNTNFISAMPTNLYGPNDNFDLKTSHVLPALIRKFHEAKLNKDKEVVIWGTGKAKREFLHVDDLADALLFLMNNYNGEEFVNVGVGKDISILELAELIKDIVGYDGEIVNDLSKPDGTPRKLLDVTRLNDLGWEAQILLEEGIKDTYEWFKENY
ncbi:GDP-L-fucose synthase [Halanaerobium saccharolyticum]|uniref:GDP-L-fucose synthase n=1 Tax=Halanaerobium saccharolyticum TaxID=43595 RepID=A0A4R6R7M6_9FIRM|nr:GDP-L-fucose synthase [Halanaerobium saccharolyticum]TDP81567.1 GDP-L-fucose synthase [Halanaerobium saccharolyticum]